MIFLLNLTVNNRVNGDENKMMILNRRDSIVVQTSKGNDILNSRDEVNDSPFFKHSIESLKQKFSNLTFKSEPSSTYNCHGMTFANRRTNIFEISEIGKILNDDRYIHVNLKEVLPGDIALYYSEDGDIEHSAIVIQKPDNDLNVAFVISKWGSLHEVIHPIYICPYDTSNIRYFRCRL